MKGNIFFILIFSALMLFACKKDEKKYDVNIIYLHHSTGEILWNGESASLVDKIVEKIGFNTGSNKGLLPSLMKSYNARSQKNYNIEERVFPKSNPYGWNNFPYDYYNIWVKNQGDQPYLEEPTLEILTKKYQVIIFKHCFPVCYIQPDDQNPDINSDVKTLANYKLQYNALRNKLHAFPNTKFILFTGASQVEATISEEAALRAKEFFNWVKNEWDIPNDNISLWDLYNLQTRGGLYLQSEFAESLDNSHPNTKFAEYATPKLFKRIIDVIETNGKETLLTGDSK